MNFGLIIKNKKYEIIKVIKQLEFKFLNFFLKKIFNYFELLIILVLKIKNIKILKLSHFIKKYYILNKYIYLNYNYIYLI